MARFVAALRLILGAAAYDGDSIALMQSQVLQLRGDRSPKPADHSEKSYDQQIYMYPALEEVTRESRMEEFQDEIPAVEHVRTPSNQQFNTSQCVKGDVWLAVLSDSHEHRLPNIQRNNPLQVQRIAPAEEGTSFWERKMRGTLDWLKSCPEVDLVVVSDDDIYINPLSRDDLRSRFKEAAYSGAQVVVSSEQSCWFGHVCTPEEANKFLESVREASGNPDITQFPNSQYAGKRQAVIKMLERMLEVSPEDDQQAISLVMQEMPTKLALDHQERLFSSFDRGMVRGWEGSRLLCNFGGDRSLPCTRSHGPGTNQVYTWGECKAEGKMLYLKDKVPVEADDWHAPLMFHFNGPARRTVYSGAGCAEVFEWHLNH